MTFLFPPQLYVITSGSTEDGILPVRCQEHVVPMALSMGYGFICATNLCNTSKIYHLFKKIDKLVAN
jgi:hypothetical protein